MSNTLVSLGISLIGLTRSVRCIRTRASDVWFTSSVEEVVLGSTVHPDLLFAYRLFAFLFAVLVSLIHLKIKGVKPLRFYTKWNFYSLMSYFGLTVWETLWFRRRRSKDREHPFGPGSYLAIVLYHLNMTTVWAVDIGTWAFLYPLSRPYPDLGPTFFFNAFSYIEHALNLFIMLGEYMMNDMPFFDHLRGLVGLWVVIYVMWSFLHHVHTGLWIYPVLNTAFQWSPAVYSLAFFGHFCAFRMFHGLHWIKAQMLSNYKVYNKVEWQHHQQQSTQ